MIKKMNPNFENMAYRPFIVQDECLNSENDPDINFYRDISALDAKYLTPQDFQGQFECFKKDSISVLHLNIRSMNKNFENFKDFYASLNFNFSIVCFTETWAEDNSISKNSNFQLENYSVIHQSRENRKGGGLSIFVHENPLTS